MKSDEAAAEIRQAIRQGVLAPGQELLQDEYARRLGLSRIPLREALQSLTAVGILTASGRGFRVTRLDADEIDELYRLRLQIEPALAADVVGAIRPAQLDRLRQLDRAMGDAGSNHAEWVQLNHLFHVELYRAADRPHTLRIVRQLLDLVAPYSNLYVHTLEGRARAESEHGEMVAAIEECRADELERQIEAHLIGARDGILTEMKRIPAGSLVSRLAQPPTADPDHHRDPAGTGAGTGAGASAERIGGGR